MPSARTRSSPARPGPPARWGGPAATGSPWPPRVAPPSEPRAGSSWAPSPLPAGTERIDTLVLSGGPGAEEAARDEAVLDFVRRTAPRCRRVATVCSGAFLGAAAGLFEGRRVTTHWARAGQLAEELSRSHRRRRSDLHPRRQVLVERRGHRRHRPLAGAGPGGPRRRRGPDRGPLAGHVPAPARRADPVRVAGVGPARRALDHPGRADPRRGRTRRRPPAARPRRRGGHERPPLHPGVHRRGGREPRAASSSAPAWKPPGASSRRPPTPSTWWRRAAGSAAPRPCAASSNATSAWRPTPTGRRFRASSNERTSA